MFLEEIIEASGDEDEYNQEEVHVKKVLDRGKLRQLTRALNCVGSDGSHSVGRRRLAIAFVNR